MQNLGSVSQTRGIRFPVVLQFLSLIFGLVMREMKEFRSIQFLYVRVFFCSVKKSRGFVSANKRIRKASSCFIIQISLGYLPSVLSFRFLQMILLLFYHSDFSRLFCFCFQRYPKKFVPDFVLIIAQWRRKSQVLFLNKENRKDCISYSQLFSLVLDSLEGFLLLSSILWIFFSMI